MTVRNHISRQIRQKHNCTGKCTLGPSHVSNARASGLLGLGSAGSERWRLPALGSAAGSVNRTAPFFRLTGNHSKRFGFFFSKLFQVADDLRMRSRLGKLICLLV